MEKKIMMIEESLYEFSKRGRPKKGKKPLLKMRGINSPDEWNNLDDEEIINNIDVVDTSDMENAEEIEVENDEFGGELETALNNEIEIPEFNRRTLTFHLSGDLEKIYNGVPMAKMGNGEAFLFKLDDGKLKKIFLKDIIVEQLKRKDNRAFTINE